jgi:hypothetical protein
VKIKMHQVYIIIVNLKKTKGETVMKKFMIFVFVVVAMLTMMSLTSCGQKQEADTSHVQLPNFDQIAADEGDVYLFRTETTVDEIDNDDYWTRVEIINIKDYKISGISSVCLNPVDGTTHMAPHLCEEEGHLDCGVYIQEVEDGLIVIYFNSPAFDAYHGWYMLVPRERVTYRVSL